MIKSQNEKFFKVKASPYFWREKAAELKFAAEIIWPHAEATLDQAFKLAIDDKEPDELEPHTFSIFLSLIGFSTEALFKGIIIRDNPSLISNGKLSSQLIIHDLIKLSKLAKFPLTQNETIFCRQAYDAMIVDSRYPIPRAVEKPNTVLEIGGHCKEVFTELYNRIYPTIGQMYSVKNDIMFDMELSSS